MQSEMLLPAIGGFIAGVILTYLVLRLTKGSIKNQAKTENALQQAKAELAEQKKQLERHFAESASLLKTLSEDYQKLYRHLAASSTTLLPEFKELFNGSTVNQDKPRIEPTISDLKTITEENEDQPRDYSEGASGILRVER
ncbi:MULTISPECIES: YhcB family protein [Basfia]|uniref:Z-ring associated protein G n=1 Tax=Mannheimia succiniciproducens (strain KCTC 0769BP / MBEL55E) TaxID=221988 RepID=Q65T17_MANSM|nr:MULTISPECIES: DUF1043 family protein [Basfia]AAU37893.1 unknown [[Mannheimia] succiniciproducens MBEL55E]SEQ33943.1 hypothetical protein SAMN02910415_01300 [Basfia succiniciproducens]